MFAALLLAARDEAAAGTETAPTGATTEAEPLSHPGSGSDEAGVPDGGDARRADPDLEGVAPELRRRLARVVRRMEELGHRVEVVEGVRTQARQDLLWKQGRELPGPRVTWTRSSLHTEGRAVDVQVNGGWTDVRAYAALQRIAAQEGLGTLGLRDPGHLELAPDADHPRLALRPRPPAPPERGRPGEAGTDPGAARSLPAALVPAAAASNGAATGVATPATPARVARPAKVARPAAVPRPGGIVLSHGASAPGSEAGATLADASLRSARGYAADPSRGEGERWTVTSDPGTDGLGGAPAPGAVGDALPGRGAPVETLAALAAAGGPGAVVTGSRPGPEAQDPDAPPREFRTPGSSVPSGSAAPGGPATGTLGVGAGLSGLQPAEGPGRSSLEAARRLDPDQAGNASPDGRRRSTAERARGPSARPALSDLPLGPNADVRVRSTSARAGGEQERRPAPSPEAGPAPSREPVARGAVRPAPVGAPDAEARMSDDGGPSTSGTRPEVSAVDTDVGMRPTARAEGLAGPGPVNGPVRGAVAGPVAGPAAPSVADRVAQVDELRQARPSGSRIHVDVADLDGDGTNLRLRMRGARVETTVEFRDPERTARARTRVDDLHRSLERAGLEPEAVTLRSGAQGADGREARDRGQQQAAPDRRFGRPGGGEDSSRRRDQNQGFREEPSTKEES